MKKKKIIVSIIMVLLAISWCALIYSLSDMNTHKSNSKSREIISIFIEDSIDVTNNMGITKINTSQEKIDKISKILNFPLRKVMHASVYFILSLVIISYINFMFDNKKIILSILITLFICIGYASIDEYHQTFVDGRTGQIRDVLIDTSGSVVGVTIFSSYYLSYSLGYRKCKKEYELKIQELEESLNKKLKKKKK